jgi:hypothetical protein
MAYRVNDYIVALCPFHDDRKPSILIYGDGWFTCLGCGRKGTWDTLHRKMNGVDVIIRPELDTRWQGPNIKKYDPEELAFVANEDLMNFPSYNWYLKLRGLEGRIETCQLGYWKGWYTIPMFDNDGQFQNLVLRAAPHIEKSSGLRYWFTGKASLYVPDWHKVNTSPYVFLVFGMLDALTLSELGFAAVTAGGTQNLRTEWLEDIRKPILVIPDQDEEPLAQKIISKLGWRGKMVRLPYRDGMKDPNDFLSRGKGQELGIFLTNTVSGVKAPDGGVLSKSVMRRLEVQAT